jgi:hypothetical protein
MTDRELLELAAKAAGIEVDCWLDEDPRARFAALVAAAEREACARLVERDDSMRWSGAADAIRAQAVDRLARHGISIPEDEEYGNPSF